MISDSCQQLRHLLEAYADGQLEPATVLAIEEHLESCEACRERVFFQRAVVCSLKRDVYSEKMPDDGRARLMAALAAEAAAEEVAEARASMPPADPVQVRPFKRIGWGVRSAVPLTAAAALALLWGTAAQGPLTRSSIHASAAGASTASQELLEELAFEHHQPLPPERTKLEELREFEPYVGVPVKPKAMRAPDTRFVGARMMPIHQERTALLQYEMGHGADAKRVSVLVYDPRRIQVGTSADLAPRTVGTAEVRVGRARGYSVAVTQRDGVGYAIASDMDTEHNAQLVNYVAE